MKHVFLSVLCCTLLVLSGCATKSPMPQQPIEPIVEQGVEKIPEVVLPENDMTLPNEAIMYYIKLEDAGASGTLLGCNDSLISEPVVIDSLFNSREQVLTYVYNLQIAGYEKPADTMTMLSPTSLQVVSVTVDDSEATVSLSGTVAIGGACDSPRIKEQLTAPALQFPEITDVNVMINNVPLDQYLSVQ